MPTSVPSPLDQKQPFYITHVSHTECFITSGADCTPKNNEKKSYKYMSYLFLFMRYNEFSVLITFTKDARNDHLAFEDKPAFI